MRNNRNFIVIMVVILTAGLFLTLVSSTELRAGRKVEKITGSKAFSQAIASGRVQEVKWQGTTITGTYTNSDKFIYEGVDSNSQVGAELAKELRSGGVNITYVASPNPSPVVSVLMALLPTVLVIGVIWFLMNRMAQANGSQAMNFGKSRARRLGENGPRVTFEDVAGIDEAKQELYEVVDFLRNTKKYAALGAKIPKGILLTGPPGVGKTHLARAIAGEAGVPFFHISGSDFVEMFVGVGAARVRDLFENAKAHRPSLIFVDEIDAVGRQRGAGLGGGHDEREQTLNQLLVEMDGFDPNSGVIMIAATNRPDVLDPALLRPGRFDRQIVVDSPDQKGRHAILQIHAKGKPLAGDVDLEQLSKRTPGFTGADLANTLNEGALLAARRGVTKIHMSDLSEALDRVIAGPQRKSRVMQAEEREIIAYHEAGHAIIGEVLEHCDPVIKVTILPRGLSLGSTWSMPETDKYLVSKEELLDDITALLGGRAAEEVKYNRVWTGASNDLQRVTAIARAMVMRYGMSEKLGTLAIGATRDNPFLGRDYYEERNYSGEVAKMIDQEVRGIVDDCHRRATEILVKHRAELDRLVAALLDRETIDRDEFLALMEGRELPEKAPPEPPIASSDDQPVAGEEKASGKGGVPPRLEPGTA